MQLPGHFPNGSQKMRPLRGKIHKPDLSSSLGNPLDPWIPTFPEPGGGFLSDHQRTTNQTDLVRDYLIAAERWP